MEMQLKRTLVTVYLKDDDGVMDQFTTYINLEPFEAAKYYVGNTFTMWYGDAEYKLKCRSIRCDGVQEYKYGQWHDIQHPDGMAWYKLQGGSIIRTEW